MISMGVWRNLAFYSIIFSANILEVIMKINKNFTRKNDNTGVTVNYETIEECPNCKKALAPQNLYGIVHSRDDKEFLSVADYCNGCHSLIVSEYEICRKVTRTLSDGRKEL